MLGLGETKDQIVQVMDDLLSANVDFLTIGQYLQPSVKHHPLQRYVHPDEFEELKKIARLINKFYGTTIINAKKRST